MASRRSALALSALSALAVIGLARGAGAEPAPRRSFEWSYFYDGGAAMFVWGSGAVALGLRLFGEPPETPLLFDPDEGGDVSPGETVPEAAISAAAILGSGVVVAVPSPARLFHLKGYGEALLTTTATTELAKAVFGRHRPYWTPEAGDEARRSFFSAHASVSFATATYLGLYLHGHLFARWRDPDQAFAWWETVPLAALAGVPTWIAWTRLDDNRHHTSDVIAGAVIGTATSISFYVYQELRYRRALESTPRTAWVDRIRLMPSLEQPGLVVFGAF